MKYVEDFESKKMSEIVASLSLCTEHSYQDQEPSHICFDEAIGGLDCRDFHARNVAKQRDFYSYY